MSRENKMPLDLFDSVRACNDRLGRYSDHEGNEDGSTFYFWRKGPAAFEKQCERAIRDHESAISAWRSLQHANNLRRYSKDSAMLTEANKKESGETQEGK